MASDEKMMEVKPIVFENLKGHRLFGMLHVPENQRRDVAIIILSPGIKNRVAPHRLYVKMARRFVDRGFQVLRFDPEGLGDSEGDIDEKFTANLYGSIQVGRFVDDTICAMDWMETERQISCFVLSGLCGGAITGLLTGSRDKRVDALLGLGIPVILDSMDIDPSAYMTQGQLAGLREKYQKKVFNPTAWLRFLTFRSDYRLLLKSFWASKSRTLSADGKPVRVGKAVGDEGQGQPRDNFNPLFSAAFEKMLSANRAIHLIFSEADRLYWEFEEKFVQGNPDRCSTGKDLLSVSVIKGANHIFSFSEWQEDMFQTAASWLESRYGG